MGTTRSTDRSTDSTITDAAFRRAFAMVLRQYGPAFEALARSDECPARSDPCCTVYGACDGSCVGTRA